MTVTRKIFLAIVSFVVCLAAIFVFLTYFVIKESFEVMAGHARGELMEELSQQFTRYYNQHGDSWEGIGQFTPDGAAWRQYPEASIVLLSKDHREL